MNSPFFITTSEKTTGLVTASGMNVYITAITLNSINADAYNYYRLIADQLIAQERIFNPISTQITGNIKCISDPTLIALG